METERMIHECIDGQHKEKCPGYAVAITGPSTGTKCLCVCHEEDKLLETKPEPKKKLSFLSSVCQEKTHDGCPVTRAETEEFGEWNCPCDCHNNKKART